MEKAGWKTHGIVDAETRVVKVEELLLVGLGLGQLPGVDVVASLDVSRIR